MRLERKSRPMKDRKPLGEQTDLAAVGAVTSVAGLNVVDVGCAAGQNARDLATMGALVLAAEPDAIQAAKNRQAEPVSGLTFVEARAESLPIEAKSADGVFLFRSLHHVPVDAMDGALAEAARVLKPDSGFLCVIEPGMDGTLYKLVRLYHDETRARIAAQAALDRCSRLFSRDEYFSYVQFRRYPDFEAMVWRATGLSYNNIRREQVETDEVRRVFEAERSESGDHVFDEPMLMDVHW